MYPLVPFLAGSPIMISGPTGVGKTYFTYRLLSSNMFTETIDSVLYCYGVYQPFFDTMSMTSLEFHDGVPGLDTVQKLHNGKFNIIVLDDLLDHVIKSVDTQNLFTKYCHHYNITVILLTQNVFAQGPCSRTISLNTHILILFANKRDESQAITLGKQLYPHNVKGFLQAYEDATTQPFGYLVVDCDPKSPRQLKLRTNIFPGDVPICYLKQKALGNNLSLG